MVIRLCNQRHGIVTINSRLEESGGVYGRESPETLALFRSLATASTLSPCRRHGWPKTAADTSIWRSRAANEASSSSARYACRALAGASMARSICRSLDAPVEKAGTEPVAVAFQRQGPSAPRRARDRKDRENTRRTARTPKEDGAGSEARCACRLRASCGHLLSPPF